MVGADGNMNQFNRLPKNVKKTVRYIKQDASYEQIVEMKKLINHIMNKRLNELKKEG
ncbi:hypothetical protein J2S09_001212 [Bacillus fengqiuensis]|nr:hypothetical protein [Bacillus fengqiuensis]